ncbi:MAG: HD domain-containing protein, partial [Clostridia bacterium]|nr:HD domain-containing protein [Clostridia bacterium]
MIGKHKKAIGSLFLAAIVSAAFLFFTDASAAAKSNLTDYVETLYASESGISTNESNAIVATSDGYIWTGGYGGLMRYDGRSFENFSRSDIGMTSTSIRALFEDSTGRLWVGTNEQGIFYYDNGTFHNINDPQSTEHLSVRCFTESEGTIYAGTSDGMIRITENQIMPLDIDTINGRTVYTLSTDKYGNLWGVETSGSLFCIRNNLLASWFSPGLFWQNYAYSAAVTSNNEIIVGTNTDEIAILTHTGTGYKASDFTSTTLKANGITATNYIYETADGMVWLCADSGTGYINLSNRTFTHAAFAKNAQSLGCMTQDHEGNIWMSSSTKGVIKFTKGAYSRLGDNSPVSGNVVNSVYYSGGYYYIGTESGLFICDSSWNTIENALTQYFSGVSIRHITSDHEGRLWFCTYYSKGAVRYDPSTGEFRPFYHDDGIKGEKLRMVLPLSNGDIAIGSSEGIYIVRNDTIVAHYGQSDGMKNPFILCMVELDDGSILVGSDGLGLYLIKDGVVTNYHRNVGFAGGVILRIVPDDRSDNLWVSTGSELYYGNLTDGFSKTAVLDKGSGSIFEIYLSGENVWILRNSSLLKVNRSQLLTPDSTAVCVEYGKARGLIAPLVANSWSSLSEQGFAVCTTAGVCLLDITESDNSGIVPVIAANSVYADADNVPVSKNIRIDSSVHRVTIDLSVLSYNQRPVDIYYRLDGFSSEWTVMRYGSFTPIVYTNLPGGEYTFRYKAISSDGIASEEHNIIIIKEKSLFEHAWVWILIGVLVAASAYICARLIMNAKVIAEKKKKEGYKRITDQGLLTIANTIDAKDAYTNGHSRRVAAYSRELASRLGVKDPENIYYIALLHDIGKIGIPDNILNKPDTLTPEEYKIIQRHPVIGGEILRDFTAVSG